jgi:hypothetical protein
VETGVEGAKRVTKEAESKIKAEKGHGMKKGNNERKSDTNLRNASEKERTKERI